MTRQSGARWMSSKYRVRTEFGWAHAATLRDILEDVETYPDTYLRDADPRGIEVQKLTGHGDDVEYVTYGHIVGGRLVKW